MATQQLHGAIYTHYYIFYQTIMTQLALKILKEMFCKTKKITGQNRSILFGNTLAYFLILNIYFWLPKTEIKISISFILKYMWKKKQLDQWQHCSGGGGQTHRQTNKTHSDIVTFRLNRPRTWISENVNAYSLNLLLFLGFQ